MRTLCCRQPLPTHLRDGCMLLALNLLTCLVQLVGSSEEFGRWGPLEGPLLRWNEGNVWKASIRLPCTLEKLEFKVSRWCNKSGCPVMGCYDFSLASFLEMDVKRACPPCLTYQSCFWPPLLVIPLALYQPAGRVHTSL